MWKRTIAIVLCLVMGIGCMGVGAAAAAPVLQTEIESTLAELVETYEGETYTGNFYGATQCKGFADMIYDALFDVGSVGYYPSDIYYMYLNGSHTTEVGRVEPGYTKNAEGVAAVKTLLSQAVPGDYIQMKRPAGYGHSQIVLGTDDTGVTVLHCNWFGTSLISVDHFTWEDLSIISDGISLYHFSNYLKAGEYTDVADTAWYFNHIKYVSQFGLMNGMDKTTFNPDGAMTRGMVVTVLYRMSGDTGTYTAGFKDVAAGRYYTKAIAWAQANGIAAGYADGTFKPDQPIDRAQLAVFLYRFAKYQDYDVSAAADLNQFKDAGQIPTYAVKAMCWAAGEKIFQGSGGMVRPLHNATRAEVAKVLAVYHKLLNQSAVPAAASEPVCMADAPAPELTGLAGLQQQIALQLHNYDGIWSVYFVELSTGESVCMNEAPMPAGDWIEWFDQADGYPMTVYAGTAGGPDVDLTSAADFGRLLEATCGAEPMQIANASNAAWVVPGQYILCVMSDGAGDVTDEMAQLHALVDSALGN